MAEDDAVPEPAVAPESGASGPRRPWLIVAIALAVVVVVVVAAVAVKRSRSSSKTPTATLEPAGAAGDNPFTDSFAIGTPAAFPKQVRGIVTQLRNKMPLSKQTQTRVATGTAPGVYGGNGATRACNSQALITYLRKNPGNAAAWAKASGIPRHNISIFVTSLTPVVLMNDTRVTNHGYDQATIAPRQSILQAGTAVMVDTTGTPRVVCNSGNPLTATRPIVITKTRGDAWPGFDAKAVTTIKPGTAVQTLTLLNTQTGEYYRQPTGNGSAAPISVTGQWVVAEPNFAGAKLKSTTLVAISTGRPWAPVATIPGEGVAGLAWGDGKWVAVTNANFGGKGNHVLESTDLHTWKQVAALPNRLSSIAYGNGLWTATAMHTTPGRGPNAPTHASGVIYTSTDAKRWTQVAETGGVANSRRQPVAYGNGEWLTVVGTNNASSGTAVPELEMYTSLDGQHWTPNGGAIRGQLERGARVRPADLGDRLDTGDGGQRRHQLGHERREVDLVVDRPDARGHLRNRFRQHPMDGRRERRTRPPRVDVLHQ